MIVVCYTLTNIPRVDFTKISFRSPLADFACSHLEQDGDKLELGRGLLQECSKLDMLEMIVRNILEIMLMLLKIL